MTTGGSKNSQIQVHVIRKNLAKFAVDCMAHQKMNSTDKGVMGSQLWSLNLCFDITTILTSGKPIVDNWLCTRCNFL